MEHRRRKRCKHGRSKLPLPWSGQVEPYAGYESDVRKINWDFVVILMYIESEENETAKGDQVREERSTEG